MTRNLFFSWFMSTVLVAQNAQSQQPPVVSSKQPDIPASRSSGDEFTLSASRNQKWNLFSMSDFEEYRKWINIHYTMSRGVGADNKRNHPVVVGLSFSVERHAENGGHGCKINRGSVWDQARIRGRVPSLDYTVRLPAISTGDVLPLTNGMLFQVKSLDDENDAMVLERIFPSQFSKSPKISENCRIIPFGDLPFSGPGTELGAGYSSVRAKIVHRQQQNHDSASQAEGDRVVVQIDLFRWPPGENVILSKPIKEMAIVLEITIGSKIQIGGIEYTVRNIVFPDPENHIIGWVELEMPPFNETKETNAWEKEQEMWKERWGTIQHP